MAVFVEFQNKGDGLGIPLPKGIVRVYKKDTQGNAQFVGEDQIDHTPRNETVRLKLGDAFDVTADRRQTDFKRLAEESRDVVIFETAYRLVLKNAKREAVTVVVRGAGSGGDLVRRYRNRSRTPKLLQGIGGMENTGAC